MFFKNSWFLIAKSTLVKKGHEIQGSGEMCESKPKKRIKRNLWEKIQYEDAGIEERREKI